MKAAQSWQSVHFIIGGIFYAIGAGVWLMILRTYPLYLAFPIATGALITGTTLISFFLLNESIRGRDLLGILFIFIGIAILAMNLTSYD